ncbi:Hypothetical_protein [Hexamita inflata]|uniref:Hypothetical_protein n=1 Tax=Hexamita inflata TaxID=28002 RepID=A0AA86NB29_9EUKA|nr:Hypothetical protein HINF_LOCUS3790 [Hexamita inflata]
MYSPLTIKQPLLKNGLAQNQQKILLPSAQKAYTSVYSQQFRNQRIIDSLGVNLTSFESNNTPFLASQRPLSQTQSPARMNQIFNSSIIQQSPKRVSTAKASSNDSFSNENDISQHFTQPYKLRTKLQQDFEVEIGLATAIEQKLFLLSQNQPTNGQTLLSVIKELRPSTFNENELEIFQTAQNQSFDELIYNQTRFKSHYLPRIVMCGDLEHLFFKALFQTTLKTELFQLFDQLKSGIFVVLEKKPLVQKGIEIYVQSAIKKSQQTSTDLLNQQEDFKYSKKYNKEIQACVDKIVQNELEFQQQVVQCNAAWEIVDLRAKYDKNVKVAVNMIKDMLE